MESLPVALSRKALAFAALFPLIELTNEAKESVSLREIFCPFTLNVTTPETAV
ncbi:hypothetical protein D3C71_2134400 [compost metagenome]